MRLAWGGEATSNSKARLQPEGRELESCLAPATALRRQQRTRKCWYWRVACHRFEPAQDHAASGSRMRVQCEGRTGSPAPESCRDYRELWSGSGCHAQAAHHGSSHRSRLTVPDLLGFVRWTYPRVLRTLVWPAATFSSESPARRSAHSVASEMATHQLARRAGGRCSGDYGRPAPRRLAIPTGTSSSIKRPFVASHSAVRSGLMARISGAIARASSSRSTET